MRKLTIAALLVFGLGCAGFGERLVELGTGGEVEITEDGMVMKMEDGTTVTVQTGARAQVPADFPLPPPWEGATPESLTRTTTPDGKDSALLTYQLAKPKEEVVATYRAWFEAQGITPKETVEEAMGMRTETLVGPLPDGRQAGVVVSLAFGQDSVTIMVGHDLDSLQEL